MNREDLPVEVREHELPKDSNKHYKMFYDYHVRTSGGFADACFLGAVMLICFMWGMLVVILR
ncbi:MAG: hypothetical protein MR598_05000 [Erysipelotrichaceae bacterium]|nr:hypothetical protein [Erysipelotrichaceae bacterium]